MFDGVDFGIIDAGRFVELVAMGLGNHLYRSVGRSFFPFYGLWGSVTSVNYCMLLHFGTPFKGALVLVCQNGSMEVGVVSEISIGGIESGVTYTHWQWP